MAELDWHDYSLATKVERLVAQLEQCFRGWLLTGLENISHLPPAVGLDRQPTSVVRVSNTLEHRMPWRSQPYILTLHVPYTREADLHAAKQRQQAAQAAAQHAAAQQQQQAAAQRQQQAQQAAAQPQQQQAARQPSPRGQQGAAAAAAAPAAAPSAADMQQAVSAASRALAQRVAASAFAGGPAAVEKLQAQLAPLVSSGSSSNVAGAAPGEAATAATAASSNEDLQQQVQELIQQYHQVSLQLQADAEHEQEQQQEEGAQADGEPDASSAAHAAESGTGNSGSLAAAVLCGLGLGSSSRASSSGGGRRVSDAAGSTGSPAAPRGDLSEADAAGGGGGGKAPARGGRARQLNARRLSRPSDGRASSSGGGSGASAASAAVPAAGCLEEQDDAAAEQGDEASSRRVELPAADELVAAGSSALAAVRAAVQQDHSRTSASRTWWPLCFDVALLRQQAGAPGWQAACARGVPSLRPPWWSPGAGGHKLQRWFGLDLFVLLQPASYSRRFLDAAESSSLLSVGRLALAGSGVGWPLLLPVHDALRDAYVGCAQVGGASVALTTDSVHISRLPRHMAAPDAQLRLFAEQLLPHSPAAAAACLAVVGHAAEPALWPDGGGGQQQQQYGVWASACFTFCLPDASLDHWLQQALTSSDGGGAQEPHLLPEPLPLEQQLRQQQSEQQPLDDDDLAALDDWDADAAWHPWAQYRDPVHALELDVVWADQRLAPAGGDGGGHTAAAGPGAPPSQAQQQLSCEALARLLADPCAADVWLLHVLAHGFSNAPRRPGPLGVRSIERHRRHVRVSPSGADWLWTCEAAAAALAHGGRLSGVCPQPWGAPAPPPAADLDPGSFATMLSALLTARSAAAGARSLWELAGAEWWEARGELVAPPLPPDSVLDGVLRDLLSPPRAAPDGGDGAGAAGVALPRAAPPASLLCRLALHALLFGNARAVAALWQRFVVHLRLSFWEQRALLPHLPAGAGGARAGRSSDGRRASGSAAGSAGGVGGPPPPDLDACLLHQKLQMLNVCIWRRDARLGSGAGRRRQPPRSRDASSGELSSGSGSGSCAQTSDEDGGGGGAVARSGSRASGLATAASSTFFSASGGDDEDAEAQALAEAAATALPDDGSDGGGAGPQEQEQQQQQQQQPARAADDDEDAFSGAGVTAAAAEWEQREPAGVAGEVPGQFLLRHPGRPLRVPVVQDAPLFTEDQLIQREAALMQLSVAAAEGRGGGGSGAAAAGQQQQQQQQQQQLLLKQRLLAAPLLADMSAFKAANPGCCFEDFLRWFSPKDWQQQAAAAAAPAGGGGGGGNAQARAGDAGDSSSSSSSSSSEGSTSAGAPRNDWRELWALAEPLPAAAQRPLLNPQKEGEQVLHHLETLSPAALFSQLLAAAVTEALSLLAASRGAALPAAAAVVARFSAMAAGVLRKGGGFSEALAAAAAATAAPPGREQQADAAAAAAAHELAGDWQGAEDGLSDAELELLLAEFCYVEQVVVLGEALLHHLPGQPALAARLLQHLLHGCGDGAEAERAVLGAATRLPVAALSPDERGALLRWVAALEGEDGDDGGAGPTLHDLDDAPQRGDDGGGAAAAGGAVPAAPGSAPQQQQQQQQPSPAAQLRRLQHALGAPVQQEWVTTCGPVVRLDEAPAAGGGARARPARLAPAVAAAVAAAVTPPSRLYLQEADGEMRIAALLVGQRGL